MNYASVLLKTSDIRQDTFCNLINEREREGEEMTTIPYTKTSRMIKVLKQNSSTEAKTKY